MKSMMTIASAAMILCLVNGTGYASEEISTAQDTVVIEISTAEELAAVNDDLSANYVLTADIDLEGAEWVPLGSFVQSGEEGEEAETPDPAYAFTGTFDGGGHTISNFRIDQPEAWALGLFGCIANAGISDFTVENVTVDGSAMVSAVAGYSYCSTVSGVTLDNAVITAHTGEMSSEGMYGGIVAAGMMSVIENCAAKADIYLPDNTANAGIVGGGLELTSVKGSFASGTVTAGNNCYGLGGISGCGFGAEEFSGCTAADVTVTAGDDCFWIGGLTGYAGGYEAEEAGVPVTSVSDCTLKNVEIIIGKNADGIGEIVGAGFYMEGLAEAYGFDYYAAPTVYTLTDCDAGDVAIHAAGEDDIQAQDGTPGEEETIAGKDPEGAGIFNAIAGENGTTYENFFDVTLAEENYSLWYDCTAAIVGESAAADTVAFMQGYISADRDGEDAVAYYAENPDETPVFDCFFINGLKLVTFSPDGSVTAEFEDGSKETHSYDYLGTYPIGKDETMMYMGQEISVEFPCDVYRSTDEAGELNYLFLRDDTMEETGHIEFRYGRDLVDLQGYFVGPYAYWLTAGFDVNADEDTPKSTVELFCLENMDYSSHIEEAVSQISGFMGTWNADLSAFGEAYADTVLYFTIDENGHGVTFMDGEQTADFEAYAYDSGEKGDGKGIYIAYSNLEYEAEAAEYVLETGDDGETVLTLYAKDGVISYKKAD